MADDEYDVGDVAQLTGTFRDVANALVDPTTTACVVKKPDGTSVSLTTTRASLGVYTAALTIDQTGVYWYRFTGTGAVAASGEKSLRVRARQVA